MSMQHNPKACAIFSRVRQGKAYVNDLPTVLHILKIPMNDSEMRQVLKTVDIDESILEAVNKLQGSYISLEELQSALPTLGITLSDEDIQKIVSEINIESGMVNLDDFIMAVSKEHNFTEYDGTNLFSELNDAIEGLSKIQDENVAYDVVEICLQNFGVYLPKPELKKIKKLTAVDGDKVQVKEFSKVVKDMLDTLRVKDNMEVKLKDFLMAMKNTPSFKDSIATQLLLTIPQVLQKDRIDVSDFKKLLVNDYLHSAETILTEMLKNVPEHEKGKVTIQDFLTKFVDTLTTLKYEREKEKLYNTDIDRNDLNAISDIKQNLNAIGIHLTDGEIQKVLDNTTPSSDVVKLKAIIRELANTDICNECQRIEDTYNVVDKITDGKVEVNDLLSILKSFKTSGQPEVFPTSEMDGLLKEITFFDNIKNNMSANELISNLSSTGIPISSNTLKEILRKASVDGEFFFPIV
ncbi:EF-hand domain-containing protein C17orf57 [Cricetulus griseus]|uniref:EF-hand domain-containing protein C17orf57 n=1 Tax=Cricetulus griseus TaxID=10029 RepID=G3HGD2_CRIGR|nr:EF-hand domain-containing protein C17orf57 [Cricetulus griseus]